MAKVVLLLKGLDCPNCSAVIENAAKKMAGVESADLNLLKQQLNIFFKDDAEQQVVIDKITKLVGSLEPHVMVRELSAKIENETVVETESETKFSKDVVKLIAAAVVYVAAILMQKFGVGEILVFAIYLLALVVSGGEVIWTAVKNIAKGRVFDENFLMSVATIGAFIIGEYAEGVAVMLFYQVGELFQSYAVGKSRKSIAELMDIRPDYANLKVGETYQKVAPEQVILGDVIQVRTGEKIPLDGLVLEGSSSLDTVALTGESVPRSVRKGDTVLSGCINLDGVLLLQVTKTFGESTVMKILDLVENATSKKSKSESFITRFARYYTPIVVVLAVLLAVLPPLIIAGESFGDWFYRALVFLVVSCPCALVISIPLGFFGGIGGASRVGILVKGSNYLENLSKTDTVVFDKTGTLTKGVFEVSEIHCYKGSEAEIIDFAAHAECYSTHPIAISLRNALAKYDLLLNESRVSDIKEIAGHGIEAMIDNKKVLVGNAKLLEKANIDYVESISKGTVVFVAVNGEYFGEIIIADSLKGDAKATIDGLKDMGIRKILMLTGDTNSVAEDISKSLGIDYYAELLPGDKVAKVEELLAEQDEKGKLVFVGDGINDAPVLARADIGIAMGALGSDAAIEAADVVLMTDQPSKLVSALKISNRTIKIVKQNIVLALGIKGIVLILGAMGIATMWLAVFADVGVAVLAILNAMRALSIKKI